MKLCFWRDTVVVKRSVGIVGTFSEPTDQVLAAQAAVPEPAGLAAWGLLLAVLAFPRRRPTAKVPGMP